MRKWIVGLNLVTLLGLLSLSSVIAEEPETNPDNVTITDIEAWKHPVKTALQQNRIALFKVEICRKTYPTFYVGLPMDLNVSSAKYYDALCRTIAQTNDYENYAMKDEKRQLRFMVACNEKFQKVVNIIANGEDGKLERLLGAANGSGTAVFEKVARQTVGLDSVPYLDLSHFKLNPCLLGEVKAEAENRDIKEVFYQHVRGVILCNRFKRPIIGNIKIGTPLAQVLKILGPPSFNFYGQIFYKTSRFYLGFAGKTKVEKAIVGPVGKKIYAKEVLLRIATRLNTEKESGSIFDILTGKEMEDFFGTRGYIHEGFYYLDSESGVYVTQCDEGWCIRVYNNFQGDLYRLRSGKSKYPILYENGDWIAGRLSLNLDTFDQNIFDQSNEDLAKEGVLSPGGKRKFIYERDQQWFYVRTLDYSRADVVSQADAEEYRWLNDDYIIYTALSSTKPYVLPVNGQTGGAIDVLETIGIKVRYEGNINFKFKIKSVTKDQLVIAKINETTGKTANLIKIHFKMDAKGKLVFGKG